MANINDSSTNSTRFAGLIRRFGIIAIIAVALFLLGYQYFQHFVFKSYKDGPSIIIENDDMTSDTYDFNYRVKDKEDAFEETFRAYITKDDVGRLQEDYLTLFTPYIQSEAFQIYINGHLVSAEGDMSEGRSNLWAHHFYFNFEKSILDKETNIIELRTFSRYISGGIGNPFMISGYSDASRLRNSYGFDIYDAINGITFSLIIVTLMVAFTVPVDRYKFTLMLSMLAVMVFSNFELIHLSDTIVPFIIYKKVSISANMFVIGLGTLLFRYMLGYRKKRIPILAASMLIAFVPAFVSPTMQIYKSIYDVTFILSVLVAVYWAWIAFRKLSDNFDARIILTLAMTFIVYVILYLVGELFYQNVLISVTSILLPIYMIFVLVYDFIEIHEERSLKESFESLSQEYVTMFNNSQSGIIFTKGDNVIHRLNDRAREIIGVSEKEKVIGMDFAELLGLDERFHAFRDRMISGIEANGSSSAEQLVRDFNGIDLWIKVSGKSVDTSYPRDLKKGIVWVFDDISDRKKAELKLKEVASKDYLTGIRNRRDFEEAAQSALAYHKRYGRTMCLLMLDIDKFKVINDTYGHSTGDKSLVLLSNICSGMIRENDIFGRIGGEEFAIILVEIDKDTAHRVADRIRRKIQQGSEESELPSMTISIGLAESTPESTLGALMKAADVNLYKAKEGGRNMVVSE